MYVAELGFEPRNTASKAAVIPFHHSAVDIGGILPKNKAMCHNLTMSWEIEFFVNNRRDMPVSQFMNELDDATLQKVMKVIDLLSIYGPMLTTPYSKKITKNISELRTTGKNPIRILYCHKYRSFVLLHIFKKKTNKLPPKELKLAESRFDIL